MNFSKKFLVEPGSQGQARRSSIRAFTATMRIDARRQAGARAQSQRQADRACSACSTATAAAVAADRAAGHRRRRQGRHLLARDQRHGPAGRARCRASSSRRPRSRRTTSCGASIRMRRGKGEVAVFNRSHYEDVLVVRVHKLVPEGGLAGALRLHQRVGKASRTTRTTRRS